MFFTLLLSFLAASSFLCVQAQSSTASSPAALPTSLDQVPPCVLNCTTTAATQAGCSSVTDITCVCTSTKFQSAALSCLQASCSASDQSFATTLQSALCGSVSSSAAVSGSSPAASSSATVPASTASAAATHSSAASGVIATLGTGHIIAFVAVLAGIITGTLF